MFTKILGTKIQPVLGQHLVSSAMRWPQDLHVYIGFIPLNPTAHVKTLNLSISRAFSFSTRGTLVHINSSLPVSPTLNWLELLLVGTEFQGVLHTVDILILTNMSHYPPSKSSERPSVAYEVMFQVFCLECIRRILPWCIPNWVDIIF